VRLLWIVCKRGEELPGARYRDYLRRVGDVLLSVLVAACDMAGVVSSCSCSLCIMDDWRVWRVGVDDRSRRRRQRA